MPAAKPRAAATKQPSRPSLRSTMAQGLVVGLIVYASHHLAHAIFHRAIVARSNAEDAPLVLEVSDNFLPLAALAELRAQLAAHAGLVSQLRSLNPYAAFKSTRGFVVRFNREGERRFRASRRYAPLVPLFDRLVTSAAANAFVMNVLVVGAESEPSGLARLPPAVGCHLDQDVAINVSLWRRTFTAHEVDVLYAAVPEGSVGGELRLYDFHGGLPADGAPPAQAIAPRQNTLLRFRGDAWHCVGPHAPAAPPPAHAPAEAASACAGAEGARRPECPLLGGARVSVVLEQYRIPPRWYARTRAFEEEGGGGEE